jgi:NADH:ubiquinone oxidoreductase subunit 6 (subunit J)
MKSIWRRWVALFEDKDDPAEPHYDPVHLAVVLVASQVVIGALYWLLWTVFVYEGGITARLRLAHVVAVAVCFLVVAALFNADRRHASHRRK